MHCGPASLLCILPVVVALSALAFLGQVDGAQGGGWHWGGPQPWGEACEGRAGAQGQFRIPGISGREGSFAPLPPRKSFASVEKLLQRLRGEGQAAGG